MLRVLFCFWGYPGHLPPDEATIVIGATNMLPRRSFEPNAYNRPRYFEIQCCALLFAVYSKLRYGPAADRAYLRHAMDMLPHRPAVYRLLGDFDDPAPLPDCRGGFCARRFGDLSGPVTRIYHTT